MKKSNFVLALCLLAVLLVPLWRGIAKYQDVKMECKDLQEPTDMNIVLVLEKYHSPGLMSLTNRTLWISTKVG